MASLSQQLSTFVSLLEQLRDSIPVDPATIAVTLEKHSPGNGSTYTRLRVPKGKALANGKRTMSLDTKETAAWEQKIYARNQQAKISKCLALVQQAAEVAHSITWEADETVAVVNKSEPFTIDQSKYVTPGAVSRLPKATIKYVLKDAKGATTINRTVHAISSEEPNYGRWYAPALCGERPKAGSWGWRRVDSSELSCPKCHDQLKQLT